MAVEEAKTLEECCRRLREKLDSCLERNDDIQKRFAPRGKTLEIFEQDRLEHLLRLLEYNGSTDSHRLVEYTAKKIRGSEGSRRCCNFLAVLIYSDCKRKNLVDFVELLLSEEPHRPYSDDDLPLTKDVATEHFGEDVHTFWEHQYLFCPVILKGQEENIYKGHRQSCPLPFVKEPEKIGQGAYAIVYKVVIAKGHLTNDEGSNDQHEYAMKQFTGYNAEVKKSFDDEGTTIKQIIQSVKGHRNIATTRASLEWGNTYSLFFDLAKRNLWQHFMEDRDPVKTLEERQRVFSRICGLAGALAHLHEGLKLYPTNEPLQCYHLDLKPQNILVFGTGDDQIWKISDFGMSQIKQTQPMESQHEPKHHLLDRIFQSTKPNDDPSSGVDNSRYGGTYAAPEAKEKSDTVTRKSDVWSLGCVITLVITYLHAESQGIMQFEGLRASDRSQDWFFDPEAFKAGSDNSGILHSSVLEWFQTLIRGASRRGHQEEKAIVNTIDLLRDEIFLRDEEKRLSAKKVEEKLETLVYSFFRERLPIPKTLPQRPPKRPLRIPGFDSLFHLSRPPRMASPHGPWQFNIPHLSKRSTFSADGRYLGVANNDVMKIQSVASIQEGQVGRSFKSQEDRPWADFSIGSEYLCAAVNSEYFEFVYMHLSSEEDIERFDRGTKVRCRIRRVVLSPDDQITAFVLEDSRHGSENSRVAIYRTQDLLDESISSQPSVMTYGSSTPPLPASKIDGLPWKNILRSSQDSELPADAQLADLKFSGDSSTLMGITEVFIRQQDPRYQYELLTWDVVTGRRFPSIRPPITTGFDDMGVSWEIKTFAALATKFSFAAISKKMIRWGSYDPPEYTVRSKRLDDDLLDILVPDEEEHLVLLARPNGRGYISAFRVSTNKIGGLENLGDGISIGTNHYNRNRDCCCLLERDDKLVMMLVNINKDGAKLYEKCLEW